MWTKNKILKLKFLFKIEISNIIILGDFHILFIIQIPHLENIMSFLPISYKITQFCDFEGCLNSNLVFIKTN